MAVKYGTILLMVTSVIAAITCLVAGQVEHDPAVTIKGLIFLVLAMLGKISTQLDER